VARKKGRREVKILRVLFLMPPYAICIRAEANRIAEVLTGLALIALKLAVLGLIHDLLDSLVC
jgi:hypothetical protein